MPARGLLASVVLVGCASVALGGAVSSPSAEGSSLTTAARPSSPEARTRPASPAPARGRMLAGTGVVRWGPLYAQASGYERFRYVLVSRHDGPSAARLPGTSVVYMSGTSIQRSWSTGVSYREAVANGWLLEDAAGATLENKRFGALIADVGDPAYQRRFVNNVLDYVAESKVDGVFLDDVQGDPTLLTGGVFPAKYPTVDAWEAAMVSFVSTVGKALRDKGRYVLANAAKFVPGDPRSDSGANVADFWARLAPNVDGLMNEYWLQNPNDVSELRVLGPSWRENWDGWQGLVGVAQRHGVDFFGLSYGSGANRQAMRFLRGSFLLDWDGRGGALLYAPTDSADPFHPTWVKQLGAPARAKARIRDGVFLRRYAKGVVVVNATRGPVTVRVAGVARVVPDADALFVRVRAR